MATIDEGVERISAATARLLDSMDGLDNSALAGPSLLPGWSRGHVAAHIARNADGLRNLLLAARSGEPIGIYASAETRAADIETGATRPVQVHRDDMRASAERFRVECEHYPAEHWDSKFAFFVDEPDSPLAPARALVEARLFEVEAHHVDLDAGYSFLDTPSQLVTTFLDRVTGRLGDERLSTSIHAADLDERWTLGSGGAEVSGPGYALLGWLTGRADGAELTSVHPLPDVPAY